MSFTLTSVSPTTISAEGGALVTITGTFEMGNRYTVYIGDSGATVDPVCYSGIRGQGSVAYPFDATTLKVYSPYLVPSTTAPYSLYVVNLDTAEDHTLPESITVAKKQFYTYVYTFRKVLPPIYRTGPRDIKNEQPTS